MIRPRLLVEDKSERSIAANSVQAAAVFVRGRGRPGGFLRMAGLALISKLKLQQVKQLLEDVQHHLGHKSKPLQDKHQTMMLSIRENRYSLE